MPRGRKAGTHLSDDHRNNIAIAMRRRQEERSTANLNRFRNMFARQERGAWQEVVAPPPPPPEPIEEVVEVHDPIDGENAEVDDGMADVLVEHEALPIIANLDIDDEDELTNEDNDGINNASADGTIMHKYLHAIQDRLQKELSNQFGATDETWLKKLIIDNDWWIRRKGFQYICGKLNIQFEADEMEEAYFRDVYIWLPDERWGVVHGMPKCPVCRSSEHVGNNGFRDNHYGRRVVALDHDYYCLSRRYRCRACEQKAKEQKAEELKKKAEDAAGATPGLEVVVHVTETVKPLEEHRYTFMAWNRTTLELYPYGYGSEFPAFLTHRAGVDRIIVDLMRPLFDKGLRPHALADTILELHAKQYHRECVKHELEVSKMANLGLDKKPMLSDFADKSKYNGQVPTCRYLLHVYKTFHSTIKDYLDIEVKKRGAKRLHVDASYKEAKHLCQYHGQNIFKGLITVTNEFAEIRMQFHVVTDDHEQFRPSLTAFAKTLQAYGQPDVELVFTDNVVGDKRFYLEMFPSLRVAQQRLDAITNAGTGASSEDTAVTEGHESRNKTNYCKIENDQMKVISARADINLLVTALEDSLRKRPLKDQVVGLDAEWNVEFDRGGLRRGSGKLALLILAYMDDDGKFRACLLRLHKCQSLPERLKNFLLGPTTFVGSKVSGDIKKVGKDFKCQKSMEKVKLVDLGKFARTRDVVQSGVVGLDALVKICLNETMSKDPEIRVSNKWEDAQLSHEQQKYAALDGIKSLEVYLYLRDKPDLTARLSLAEATTGLSVDIVPVRSPKTLVGLLATRCGFGTLTDDSWDRVRSEAQNKGMRLTRQGITRTSQVVQVTNVTAPHFILPHLKKENGEPVCLGDMGPTPFLAIFPLSSLKKHIDLPSIRPFPNLNEPMPVAAGPTPPAPALLAANQQHGGSRTAQHQTSTTGDNTEDDLLEEDGDVIGLDQLDMDATEAGLDLTTDDLALLRKTCILGENAISGKDLLPCAYLEPAPPPHTIRDIFLVVLGDPWHAMDRPKVPIKHSFRKVYFVSLRDALMQWDPTLLDQLKQVVKQKDNKTDIELEEDMYFNAALWKGCIPRRGLPPRLLYYRVRAVFVALGDKVDPKTGKPLFNEAAWKKAGNLLKEILDGHFSDPPGYSFYTTKLNNKGEPMLNKYGFVLLLCNRGTNDVENFHKLLVAIFGTWHIGIEMSDCLLRERRHRHNQMCSENRRLGFPRIGHCDTWLIDKLQLLVQANRGVILYPHWVNASDYKNTSETFGTVALHNEELANKLSHRVSQLPPVKLTHDMKYLCEMMGTKLPFLPVHTIEERSLFGKMILRNIKDPDEQALEWVDFVDGVKIFPKLPVHLRNYREIFQQNSRARQAFRESKQSLDSLDSLNQTLCPIEPSATDDPNTQQAPQQSNRYLWNWETVPQQPQPLLPAPPAASEPRNMCVGGVMIDKSPEVVRLENMGYMRNKRGLRGPDNPARKRSKRRCAVCKNLGKTDEEAQNCKGNNKQTNCPYYHPP